VANARTRAERIADTRVLLARSELDAWVASSSVDGGGHLVPLSIIEVYAAQAGWDPRIAGVPFIVHLLAPVRVQAWREANEIPGRTLMRNGRWLDD
jgi:hypothetical protein